MKKVGKDYKGPCPWCGGDDRFKVSPDEGERGLYYCFQCERGGDGIGLLRDLRGLSFPEACGALGLGHKVRARGSGGARAAQTPSVRRLSVPPKPKPQAPTDAPGPAWQEAARRFVDECRKALRADTGAARTALAYLHRRGFTAETIRAAGLGLNASARYPLRVAWGLPPNEGKRSGGKIWLPRGIVIPHEEAGRSAVWAVNIRRPNGDVEPGHEWKSRKYQLITGSANALYGADLLRADRPAVVVEGEFDALAIRQAAGDLSEEADTGGPLVSAVATGSTHGARRVRWIGRLAACPLVLVAFDSDEAGEDAARYWTEALEPQARRWRPYWSDPAGMLSGGADLRAWIEAALPDAAASDTSDVSDCLLEEAAIRWAYPPCAPDVYAWAKGHAAREAPPAGLERIPAEPARPANVHSIAKAWRQRKPTAGPLPHTPILDWADDPARRLVEWLCRAPGIGEEALPGRMTTEPFTLAPGRRVTNPVRFIARLRADVAHGPEGPRARTGALQDDLQRLHAMFAHEPLAGGAAT